MLGEKVIKTGHLLRRMIRSLETPLILAPTGTLWRQSDPSDPCMQLDKFTVILERLNVFGLSIS